jgi:3-hydroxybutyryl-CoA dehydrogenase
MAINKVVVCGGGVMGRGISQLIASTGTEVTLVDLTDEIVSESLKLLSEEMDSEIEKWGMTLAEKKAILSRLKGSTQLVDTCDVPLVIEAIPEDLERKRKLFRELDNLCSPDTIIVTNTSTISITELAAVTKRPDKVVGMHFLFPVTKIPLVEIVRGLKTSQKTYDFIREFAEEQLNKKAVSVYEYPGYVTTRIIVPFLNEAMHVLMEGNASAEDIDTAMKLGYGFNIGPLTLADMMGLDVVMDWMENLLKELSEHKYNPCPLLRKLVRAGHFGKKTGQGFFVYDAEGNKIGESPEIILRRYIPPSEELETK